MLKELRLKNIVLIESTEIHFQEGLNILSGETGSGKSAIMHALALIAGEKADASLIRSGFEKGIVEAHFDLEDPTIMTLLEEAGIDYEPDAGLIIRREILASGKSRAFINNQMTQAAFLKNLGSHLLEIIGQHANQKLFSLDCHRRMLDTFGELQVEVAAFSTSWAEENSVRRELDNLLNSEAKRIRDMENCRAEAEELLEARLKEGEEEELFAQYTILSSREELLQKVNEITQLLNGERLPVLTLLNKQKIVLDQIQRIDPALSETARSFENAVIELQEVAHTLRHYQSRIEQNPAKLQKINERLTLLNRLKRKYGSDMQAYLATVQTKLATLENADQDLLELRTKLDELQKRNRNLCAQLTSKRDLIARNLEKAMVLQLQALNMPKAQFEIELSAQPCNKQGEDKIEFFLVPNIGERRIPIRECASGGELSRIMLAIQTLLAGKEKMPTLIFDEIDANIGGETASIVGEKLREIGAKHQVLCITHFPQVAKNAHHHLQISKQEKEGRTITTIKTLDEKTRHHELSRMAGSSIITTELTEEG